MPLTFVKLASKVDNTKKQVRFLQKHKILPMEQKCPHCNKALTYLGSYNLSRYLRFLEIFFTEFRKRNASFRCFCQKRVCISVKKGTILDKAKISMRRLILLFYTFLQCYTYAQGMHNLCNIFLIYFQYYF